jgi:hypothetical protein
LPVTSSGIRGTLVGVLVLSAACGNGSEDEGTSQPADGPAGECGTATHAGHIVIEGTDDLAVLEGVREIEGELQLNRTPFSNIDFLGCIERVGGELTIFGNAQLIDLSGLDRLEHVGAGFIFSENAGPTELAGLGALTEVEGSVVIQGNPSLTAVSGLQSLATIGGALNIRDNDLLENIDGLRGLRTLGTQFAVTHNPSLCISSVNVVGAGITDPAVPGDDWSTRANDDSC